MLGLSNNLSKSGLVTPGIVTDSLVLKHNYAAGGVVPVSDGAAFFDGTDDYISVADAANLSFGDGSNDSAFSVSAWIKMDDIASFVIASKGVYNSTGEWSFETLASGKLALYLYDESVANTYEGGYYNSVLSANTWYHLVATYDGTGGTGASAGISIYVNGASQTVTLSDGGTYVAMENLSHDVWIGRGSTVYAGGYICNVGLWSTVLTQAQIKSIMWKNYAGLTSTETTGLVSWWNLDEADGSTVEDLHGSNDGTLS